MVPPLYACHFVARAGFARLDVIALLVVLWGARLTYNFARKGGYRWHGEDYRWTELRQRLGPVWFQVLNATFVALYQNLLLLLIVLPAYWWHRSPHLGWHNSMFGTLRRPRMPWNSSERTPVPT